MNEAEARAAKHQLETGVKRMFKWRMKPNSALLEGSRAFTSATYEAINKGQDHVCVCSNRMMDRKTVLEFQCQDTIKHHVTLWCLNLSVHMISVGSARHATLH